MSEPTPPGATSPTAPAPAPTSAPAPIAPPPGALELGAQQDDYLRAREQELTGRERLLLTALLPSALLLGGVNTVMVWLLPPADYGFFSLQSLGCYGLSGFLLGLWFYIKWRYIWSVRKAHHLSFYFKRAIEALAAVALVVMGSYLLGFEFYTTADVTQDQKLSLSPKSVRILENLPEGSRVEIYLPYGEAGLYRASELERLAIERNRRAISRICRTVQAEAGQYTKAKILFQAFDVSQKPEEAGRLAEAMGLPAAPATGKPFLPNDWLDDLVVAYTPPPPKAGEPAESTRYFYIDKAKLYQRGKPNKRGRMQEDVFVGESRLLATIERLRIDNPAKMFLVTDHSARGRALPHAENAAIAILQTNNLRLVPFELKATAVIPAEADFVMLLNIEQPLSAAECETLYNYAIGGGSLFLCIDPAVESGKSSGLEPLLEKFGLAVRQDQVIRTTVDGEALFPRARGVVPSLYQQMELPPNFEWLRRFSHGFASQSGSGDPIEMRGACYLETPRAISDPGLAAQHAKFYELLTSDRPSPGIGYIDVRATAQTPGQQDGRTGPFTLGGVVQMYLEYPPDKQPIDPGTQRKTTGKHHHLFIVTDSDWLFAQDAMARDSNQRFLDLAVQKLVGVEMVADTSDPTINFIQQDPHGAVVASVTGFLPALVLAIVGYLYLSARRQVPAEASQR